MGCLFPRADDLAALLGQHPRPASTRSPRSRDPLAARGLLRRRPQGARPDLRPPRRVPRRRSTSPPLEFGIAPNNLEATDTTQLLGLLVARAALDDAGYGAGSAATFDRDRVSVILGVTGTLELVIPLGARLGHPIWRRALKAAGVADDTADDVVQRIADSYVGWQENSFPGLLGNVAAGRIANRLDLGGTNCVVDAACASSLGAVNLALLELAAGRCDMALTGGLDTFNDIFMYMCFSKTPALSPTRRRPAVRRGGRRHDPGRGAGRPGPEAAGRRPARRRPDLRGDPRRRDVERRQGERGLRPERRGAGQGAAAGVRAGGGLARDDRAGRGARHRDEGRRRDRAGGPGRGLPRGAGRRARGAPWARSSRRSATPRRRRGRRG